VTASCPFRNAKSPPTKMHCIYQGCKSGRQKPYPSKQYATPQSHVDVTLWEMNRSSAFDPHTPRSCPSHDVATSRPMFWRYPSSLYFPLVSCNDELHFPGTLQDKLKVRLPTAQPAFKCWLQVVLQAPLLFKNATQYPIC